MAWVDILAKVPTTQRTEAANITAHPAASFDKLAREIADASNTVVMWQGARDKFEIQVTEERAKIHEGLSIAEQALAEKRLAWDAQADARGLRGVLPVAVVKPVAE